MLGVICRVQPVLLISNDQAWEGPLVEGQQSARAETLPDLAARITFRFRCLCAALCRPVDRVRADAQVLLSLLLG